MENKIISENFESESTPKTNIEGLPVSLGSEEIVEGIPGEKPAEIPGDKPEGVAGEKHEGLPEGENAGIPEEEKPEFKPEISDDLAQKIQEELDKKKEAMGEKTITQKNSSNLFRINVPKLCIMLCGI